MVADLTLGEANAFLLVKAVPSPVVEAYSRVAFEELLVGFELFHFYLASPSCIFSNAIKKLLKEV